MAISHGGKGVDYAGTWSGCCWKNFYLRAWDLLFLRCPELAQGGKRVPPRLQQAWRTATAPLHLASTACMTTATSATAVRTAPVMPPCFLQGFMTSVAVRIILFVQWPVTVFTCVCWQLGTVHMWCCLEDFCDFALQAIAGENSYILETALTLDCLHHYFWLFKLVLLVGPNLLVLRTHSSASGWTCSTLRLGEGFYL